MSRIAVLGDLNVDVFVDEARELRPGAEVRGSVQVAAGGSAGTFARVAAGLGARVVFLGAVGRDIAGDLLERSLVDAGVEACLRRGATPTGIVVAIRRGDERSMICSRGANDDLEAGWIDSYWPGYLDHLHVSGYALLAEGPRAAARRAMARAETSGASVSLDPPPANLIEAFGVERFRAELQGVRWLFPNEEEGRLLTGVPAEADIVRRLAEQYEAGALTLGTRGAIAWQAEKVDRCRAERTLDVNPTGAGDAYAAGLVVALLDGKRLDAANRAASAAASRYLSLRGA
ncbi:MAG: carbohydrate kinase family protein [Candidatus Bipolaricaulota bacterium]|nr:carbohydrate kinase family protein [Candidatus Bipolaricaulota bacterium]